MRRLGESGHGCVLGGLFVASLLLSGCSSDGEGGASTGGAGGSGAAGATSAGGTGGASAGSGGASAGGAGGSGGSAGSAGSGGAGGSGGTYSFGPSLSGSCMAYVFESCRRQAECAGRSASGCIEITFSCPDVVTSVGSTRTAEELRACAEEYAAFPCEKVNAGEIPSCVTPGTRQPGEPCLFNSQCASLSCSAEDEQCGVCDTLVGENEDCSAAGVACDFEFVCDETSQTCVKPDLAVPDELAEEGESCSSVTNCASSLDCDPDTKTCVPYPTLGMSCAGPRSCDFKDGSYCELDGLVCKAPPPLGQPCGVDGWTGTAGACGENTRCHKTSAAVGICEALVAVGSPCFVDPETQEPDPYSCVEDAYCDAQVSPALCAERLDAGESCGTSSAQCKSGLSCLCANNDPACSARVCGKLKIDSQSCSAPGDVCHPGFSCTGGVCVPIDSQGLYDATCQ